MLKQRIITAAILLPLVLLSLFLPTVWLWRLLVGGFIAIAWWEWVRLSQAEMKQGFIVLSTAILISIVIVLFGAGFLLGAVILMMLLWLLAILSCFFMSEKLSQIILPQSKLLFGAVVLGFTTWALIWLREQDHGAFWVLGFLAVIWLADTGAYFAGKSFGKNKLAPLISPGKTIEGLLGGVVCVTIYAALMAFFFNSYIAISMIAVIVMAVFIAVVSVGGDLLESWLKRQARMKDSSQILPGHGGVLDRIDSLIAALPFMLFAYQQMVPPVVEALTAAA